MNFKLGRLASRKKQRIILALRVGIHDIDFAFFTQDATGIQVSAWGSEDIAHFNVRQTLEKIFLLLSQKEVVDELIATFEAGVFRARVTLQTIPPGPNSHVIDRKEAFLIEKGARERTMREIQKLVFAESGIVPTEFSLRRVKILERRISGYAVSHLEGFRRGAIDLSILGVFLLEDPFLPLANFAKAHAIRNLRIVHIAEALEFFTRMQKKDGVYLCVEEQKTQVAVRRGERFPFPSSIPMGADNFTEVLGDTFGMMNTLAETFENRYFEGSLSQATREKLVSILLPEIKKFGILVQEKLLATKMILPDRMRIFGRGHVLLDPQHALSARIASELPFSQDPQSDFFLPKDIWVQVKDPFAKDPLYTELCLLVLTAL